MILQRASNALPLNLFYCLNFTLLFRNSGCNLTSFITFPLFILYWEALPIHIHSAEPSWFLQNRANSSQHASSAETHSDISLSKHTQMLEMIHHIESPPHITLFCHSHQLVVNYLALIAGMFISHC